MPSPGGIIFSDAVLAIRAAIDTYFGPIPPSLTSPQQAAIDARRTALASVIATATTYVRDNAIVEPGTLAVTPSNMGNAGGLLNGDGSVDVGTGYLE